MSTAPSEVPCPECGAVASRQLSGGGGLVFKGSGFYLTDYGKNAHRGKAPETKTEGGKPEAAKPEGAKPEAGKAEGGVSKSEAKAEAAKTESREPRAESGKSSKKPKSE
jgi:hypothetical protein